MCESVRELGGGGCEEEEELLTDQTVVPNVMASACYLSTVGLPGRGNR